MSKVEADVAIIGAGPAGTAAAAHLGALGVSRVVLVDKDDFPRDKTCGSGLSPKCIDVLKSLNVWNDVEPHSYWIHGMRLVTPAGLESWQTGAAQAVVCHRRVLDHILLKRALAGGTQFVPHFDASEAIEEGGRMVGFRSRTGDEIRARYVLVAGGSHCKVGLPATRPKRTIHAIMGWWDNAEFKPHHLEMIFDKMIDPYYGWLFPESDTRVNIGITYEEKKGQPKQNARKLFQEFLDKYYADALRNATQVGGWRGHPVVWSYKIEQLTAPGRIVIGEAGLMTHPATAEGIYQGMKSGMLGAEALASILKGRATEAEAFAKYERECKKAFQLSFLGAGAFRKMVRHGGLDAVVRVSQRPAIQWVTSKIMASM